MDELDARGRKGRQASAMGFANEQRLLAALLSREYNASRVDLPHSTYDIIVELSKDNLIRVQVKTAKRGIQFTGGLRGGRDRSYKSSVKEYTQNTETSDIVVGVKCERDNGDTKIDFFFVPTLFIERISPQKSIALSKVQHTMNDWELLEKCKDDNYVGARFGYKE